MIENKTDNQLGIKSVTYMLYEEFSEEPKDELVRLSNQEKLLTAESMALGEIQKSFNRRGRKNTR